MELAAIVSDGCIPPASLSPFLAPPLVLVFGEDLDLTWPWLDNLGVPIGTRNEVVPKGRQAPDPVDLASIGFAKVLA